MASPIYTCNIVWSPATLTGCYLAGVWVSYSGSALNIATVGSTVKNTLPVPVGWGPLTPKYIDTDESTVEDTSPVPDGWGPLTPKYIDTDESMVPHVVCPCIMPTNPVDPVYASAKLIGIGVGYLRSKTILCNTDDMLQDSTDEEECPNRMNEYAIHINRITEIFPR